MEGNFIVTYQSIRPYNGEWSDWVFSERQPAMVPTLRLQFDALQQAYNLHPRMGVKYYINNYEPLGKFLERTRKNRVNLTFSEIEKILKFKLPCYLYKYPAGWYGTAKASPTHRQKVVWCSYGYQVETIDLTEKKVIFRKINK